MPLAFYKPTSQTTGHACSLSFNSKDQALYVEFIKQTGWNDQTKRGSFKDGKKVRVKFSLSEVGSFLYTLEKGVEASGFHKYPDGTQTIGYKFYPYFKDKENKKGLRGFAFSVTKADTEDSSAPKEQFSVGFTFGEAAALKRYFDFVLGHFFNAIYSEDKQNFLRSQENKGGGGNSNQRSERKPAAKKNPSPKKQDEDPFDTDEDPFSSNSQDGGDESQSEAPANEPPKQKVEKTQKPAENPEPSENPDDQVF